MNRYRKLMRRIEHGHCILIDGGTLIDGDTGTEIERRGVRVIGGCCGIGPRHIEHLAEQIRGFGSG